MASLKYYLDKQLAGRPTRALYLRYKTTSGSTTFYPGQHSTLAKWDAKAQRLRGTSLDTTKQNKELVAYRANIEEIVTHYVSSRA